jgi:orotate phosphoribosyltransferase
MQIEFEELIEHFASEIYRVGAFKDKTKSPGGEGFRLKLHDINPDAPLSPIYLDFRILRSFPPLLALSGRVFEEMLKSNLSNPPHLVADIPQAITPTVTVLSQRTGIPMITPRELKTHGSGAKIDGVYEPGQSVMLFDDLITKADSKIPPADTLIQNRLKLLGVMVLADREQGGREQLQKHGISFWSAFDLTWLLRLYQRQGKISEDHFREIQVYRGK